MPQNYSLGGRLVSKEMYDKAKSINQPKEVKQVDVIKIKSTNSTIKKIVNEFTKKSNK